MFNVCPSKSTSGHEIKKSQTVDTCNVPPASLPSPVVLYCRGDHTEWRTLCGWVYTIPHVGLSFLWLFYRALMFRGKGKSDSHIQKMERAS